MSCDRVQETPQEVVRVAQRTGNSFPTLHRQPHSFCLARLLTKATHIEPISQLLFNESNLVQVPHSNTRRQEPRQERFSYYAQMVERRSHAHDDLERVHRLTRFFEGVHGELRDVRGGVVDLSEEEADLPFMCSGRLSNESR